MLKPQSLALKFNFTIWGEWVERWLQRLKALVALLDDLGSILSNHMTVYNCLEITVPVAPTPSPGLCGYCTHEVHINVGKILMNIK